MVKWKFLGFKDVTRFGSVIGILSYFSWRLNFPGASTKFQEISRSCRHPELRRLITIHYLLPDLTTIKTHTMTQCQWSTMWYAAQKHDVYDTYIRDLCTLYQVGLHWRSQDFVLRGAWERRRRVRDAFGVERGGEWRGGIPLPSRLGSGSWGSIISSPSGVRGRAPAEDGFWCFLSLKKRIWWWQIWNFFVIFIVHI